MATTQHELHTDLRARAKAVHDRIAGIVRPLVGSELTERPARGGWSAGEVLEHLCVVDEVYENSVDAMLRAARVDAGAPARGWKPMLWGRIMTAVLSNPKPVPAPKSLRPGPSPRNGVVEDFLARSRRMIERMEESSNVEWRAARMYPPTLPVRLLRMNAGDLFSIHVVHLERHARQLESIVRDVRL